MGADEALSSQLSADAALAQMIRENQLPGMSVTVLKEGEVFYQKGFGYANLETRQKIDPEYTLFRAASASKPIAATALAKMAADGIIDLDAPFHQYVPYFPKKKHDFTLRQLASHTAGIRSYKGKEYALNRPYSIKESIRVFKDDPLLFPPGTSYHYNSFDWVLVSLAMEEVVRIPFQEYVDREVIKPLGLTRTKAEVPGQHDVDQAVFYSKWRSGFKEAVAVDNRYKLAGGGYLTTSADLARLGQSYLDRNFVGQHIYDEFLTPVLIDGESTYYGMGWEVSFHKYGPPYFGHTGNSVGGYSNFYIYPEDKMVVALLINCTDPKVQDLLDEIIALWLGVSKNRTALGGNL